MKKMGSEFIDDFLIEKFINQGIGVNMYMTYMGVFKVLLLDKHIVPGDLNTYTTTNFKRFLGDNFVEKNWGSATYNKYRKCVKAYCQYLFNEGLIPENPINKITKRKEPKQLPKTLTREHVKELLDSLQNTFDKKTYVGIRNITMVYTYLYTGLRLSELINLKCSDLKIEEGVISVVKGKGGKDRMIPINNTLTKILYHYLKQRKQYINNENNLFSTVYGNSLQQRDTTVCINKIRRGITFHFTWHQLRHTFATELVRNNFDVYNISQILGHSKIDTTKIYLSVDMGKLKTQIDKINMFA